MNKYQVMDFQVLVSEIRVVKMKWSKIMALPNVREALSNASKPLAAGAMALSLALSPIATDNPAHAQQAQSHQVAVRVPAGVVMPQRTAAGYEYARFDAATSRTNPQADVITTAQHLAGNRIVVLNFMDNSPQGQRYSAMQQQVLTQTLTTLAGRSTARPLVLLDIEVRDASGQPTEFIADKMAIYRSNKLGPNPTSTIPYGAVFANGLKSDPFLFDFALLNGVRNDADLNANADAIIGRLDLTVRAANKQQVALMSYEGPSR